MFNALYYQPIYAPNACPVPSSKYLTKTVEVASVYDKGMASQLNGTVSLMLGLCLGSEVEVESRMPGDTGLESM